MQLSKRNIFLFIILLLISWNTHIKTQDSNEQSKDSNEEEKVNKEAGKVNVGKDGRAYFTADWRNTELKDFLKGMSAIVKKNILVDESIKGKKITIISQKKVEVKDAFSFLKSVLEAQGFGLVEKIKKQLSENLKKDGFKNISEVIGCNVK